MAPGPSVWRGADSQRGGTIFNLPEEDLRNNTGLGVFASLTLLNHFLRNRGRSDFHSENPRRHFEHDARADLKIILSSPTF